MPKFEIYRDVAGQYRWRLVAGNGEIVAISESYTTVYSARNSVTSIKLLARLAIVVDKTIIKPRSIFGR
jgi:hypothetical protein